MGRLSAGGLVVLFPEAYPPPEQTSEHGLARAGLPGLSGC